MHECFEICSFWSIPIDSDELVAVTEVFTGYFSTRYLKTSSEPSVNAYRKLKINVRF
jgi:hypothetical protein